MLIVVSSKSNLLLRRSLKNVFIYVRLSRLFRFLDRCRKNKSKDSFFFPLDPLDFLANVNLKSTRME